MYSPQVNIGSSRLAPMSAGEGHGAPHVGQPQAVQSDLARPAPAGALHRCDAGSPMNCGLGLGAAAAAAGAKAAAAMRLGAGRAAARQERRAALGEGILWGKGGVPPPLQHGGGGPRAAPFSAKRMKWVTSGLAGQNIISLRWMEFPRVPPIQGPQPASASSTPFIRSIASSAVRCQLA